MKRGSFIVIEGSDASGKETQSKMLLDRLNSEGIETQNISFPRYDTPTGRIIGQGLLGKRDLGEKLGWEGDYCWFGDPSKVDPMIASALYAADRRAAAPEMNKILDSGINLVSDRYYQSNEAHQGSKFETHPERIKLFQDIGTMELDLMKIPKEDGVIFLYMPWQVSVELMKRNGRDRDEIEKNEEHLRKSESVYREIAEINSRWKTIDCAPGGTIRSLRKPEDIHEEVYQVAKRIIDYAEGKTGSLYK